MGGETLYLKRLELQGFKSFADRVNFDFSKGVSAIVGPNGSGKSNVVDAVRWVLGEQSAKSLRGGKMEDVIFSGSKDRKPLGMAKVSLTLDNSEGIFDLPYHEVSVSRTLHRSGESLYEINGKSARLKDIQELFMDTGLGKDGFSVIGQGKIDEILTLHAEERRGLIEEAAGISKYKYRKREASRKLESTQDDLTRLEDILLELEDRLEPLEKQAEAVRKFKTYDQAYKDLSLKLLKSNFDLAKENFETYAKGEKESSAGLIQVQENYERKRQALEAQKTLWGTAKENLKTLQDEFSDKKTEDEALQRELGILSERLAHQEQQKAELTKRVAELKIQLEQEEELIFELTESAQKEKDLLDQLRQVKEDKNQEKNKIELEKKQVEELLVTQEEIYFNLMRQEISLKNSVSTLEDNIKTLSYKKERQNQKKDRLQEEFQKKKEDLLALEKEGKALTSNLDHLAETLKDKQEAYQKLKTEYSQCLLTNQGLEKEIASKKSRFLALREMESTGEGYFFGVASVLKAKEEGKLEGILGTIAQLIEVEDTYQVAIENALGGSLQHLVTQNDEDAKRAILYLRERKLGKATFLPLNTIRAESSHSLYQDDAILGYGNQLVRYEKCYEAIFSSLLGRVVIVRDIDKALYFLKHKKVLDRMVTLSGEVISPKGSLTGGVNKKAPILLKRNSEKRNLENELAALELDHQKGLEKRCKLEDLLTRQKEAHEGLSLKYQEEKKRQMEQAVLLESVRREIIQQEKNLTLEQADFSVLETEEKSYLAQLKKDRFTLAETKEAIGQLNEDKERLKLTLEALTKSLEAKTVGTHEANTEVSIREEKYRNLSAKLKEREEALESLGINFIKTEERLIHLSQALEETTSKQSELSQTHRDLKANLEIMTVTLKQTSQDVDTMEKSLSELEEASNILKETIYTLEKTHHQYMMKRVREEERLAEILREGEELLGQEGIDFTTLDSKDFDQEEAIAEKARLKQAIKALGELNFTAVEVYEEVSERVVFMRTQMSDLKEAEKQLMKLITEMEAVMSERFAKTYHHINRLFDEIFQSMFRGGSARLELSMPKNYLETGVEIIAKPPGKRERILSLLSGGERAMTAIALLFALLHIKPSPFVILDEIEAALDEANVDHLADFIKEYSQKSQFIIISHRKGTMEASDVLYGVTMDKDGVSKLLSVRLEDYLESEA